MATVTHFITSNYDPEADRKRLEIETGQLDAEAAAEANPGVTDAAEWEPAEDPWITEKPFGKSARILRPPRFVPATIDYNEWGSETKSIGRADERRRKGEDEDEETENVARWYRSLARKSTSRTGTPGSSMPTATSKSRPLPKEAERTAQTTKKSTIKRDRNNWFITRALEAASASSSANSSSQIPSGSSPSSTPTRVPTPTLADILARDPPPLPTEQKYTPPVWLAIGPSNKGFVMLQKSGWEEGETLGRVSRNRSGLGYKGKRKERETFDKVEDVKVEKEEIDLTSSNKEVVDLTLSDDEEAEAFTSFTDTRPTPHIQSPDTSAPTDLDHSGRALLTPLPTVLKSDRLGIGLKAKATGSGIYRAPVKRVTHSQAAIAAHVRAAEERRQMKRLVGRGQRGFERVKKREEEERRALLAYLNT